MKFFSTLNAFLILISVSASINGLTAQNNRKEIMLLDKNGATTQGTIAFKNKLKSYKSISVKDKVTGITKMYGPQDLTSFSIVVDNQTLYFKPMITEGDYAAEKSSDPLPNLDNSSRAELTKDTVFAQLLVQGKKNMYRYTDNKVYNEHYLIETDPGKGITLVNKRYYIESVKAYTAYNQEYKKQLLPLLSPTITAARINTTRFNKKDILTLVKEYNKAASSEPLTYEYKEEKAKIYFGVLAGLNNSSLSFAGSGRDLNNARFKSSTGVNVGAMMNIVLPRTGKKVSIYNELLYSGYTIKSTMGYNVYYENPTWYRSMTEATIKASYLKLHTAVCFQFPHLWTPFFQFGIGNGYAFKSSADACFETKFYTNVTTEISPLVEFRKYEQSLFGGVGLKYKKAGLEIRYERGNGMSRMSGVSSFSTYYYALLSYTF